MKRRFSIIILLLVVGCGQSYYNRGRKLTEQGHYDRAVESFYEEITARPNSAAAWRELGVAFFKQGDLPKAVDALKQAAAIMPDARTHLFLGLIHEKSSEWESAIDAYAAALNLKPGRKTRSMINTHLDRLVQKKIETEVSHALTHESEIKFDTIPPNSIAVVDFDDSHLSPELAPVAVGLAELASSDLAKVKSLKVVERLKIGAILKELELARGGAVDRSTAPRMGRLLGSRQVVTGSLLGIGEDGLRLDGVIVNTVDSSTTSTEATEGLLQNLFDLEKKFVLDVVSELGITLTPEERNAIREVPTESYLAFMSYSRGLFYQRRGMDDVARQEFENAAGLDKNFQAPRSQLQAAAAGYESSLASMETFAESGMAGLTGEGLDRQLTSLLEGSGILPSPTGSERATDQPRISGTGRVIIILDFDHD
ncbi:MAG: tetratricopeptide repeat protein [Candidatus Zixiibacteriota bacterium]|nr:MAG: tetratricopeptide repeat protein [candidate division Zixibacteria bacterium]